MNAPHLQLPNEVPLDNPIWASLTTRHAHLAIGAEIGNGLARQYPANIGPLAAFEEPTPDAYSDLAQVIPTEDIAVLFLASEPQLPDGWQLLRGGVLVQMICRRLPIPPAPDPLMQPASIQPLTPADYSEMLALASLTEPGPFRQHTAELGGFLGIRVEGRLAAMAGRRLAPVGFSEISAVCTHPDFRGRGFARALVTEVALSIYADGDTPVLTSFEANTTAIKVYEEVGFSIRRRFHLAVVKPPTKAS